MSVKDWGKDLRGFLNTQWRNVSEKEQWRVINEFGWKKGRHQTEYGDNHQKRTDWEAYYAVVEGVPEDRLALLRDMLKRRSVDFKEESTAVINAELLGDHPIFIIRAENKMMMVGHVTFTDDLTMKQVSQVRTRPREEAPAAVGVTSEAPGPTGGKTRLLTSRQRRSASHVLTSAHIMPGRPLNGEHGGAVVTVPASAQPPEDGDDQPATTQELH